MNGEWEQFGLEESTRKNVRRTRAVADTQRSRVLRVRKQSRVRTEVKSDDVSPIPKPDQLKILEQDFFESDALDLAPRLLGKILRRDDVLLQITEVEAYRPDDTACHGRFGKTSRTAPLFGPPGHAYVYLCYGLHVMLNVVADRDGVAAAVLIRSCAPVSGLQTIQARRKQQTDKPVLLTGPGKIGQALGLTTDWSEHPLYTPGGLELLDGPPPGAILVGPRVGIEYANPEHVAAPWRFAVADSAWVSAPRKTLHITSSSQDLDPAAPLKRVENFGFQTWNWGSQRENLGHNSQSLQENFSWIPTSTKCHSNNDRRSNRLNLRTPEI